MSSAYWEQVVAGGLKVPPDRPLVQLTEDLTRMLGDPDPHIRDGIAFPTLATWISEGVYDDLLVGLGDGIATGLDEGLGESGTDSVFRRSFSALVLAVVLDRDLVVDQLGADTVLRWGDRLMGWYLRERDLRGFVPGKGWAHAIAHGADALGNVARSRHLQQLELTVVLDVIADRLLAPTEEFLVAAEDDRLAMATMLLLRRNILDMSVLEPWVARIGAGAGPTDSDDHNPFFGNGNVQRYLRALHLQLALSTPRPAVRSDLLLVLMEHLRRSNQPFFPREV
ncbi:MAG TPA: DUF2785 domain-containing protein [Marmoricola sp.]|nr:DUF2785 domain-containing protein [Marmoricola sp.]